MSETTLTGIMADTLAGRVKPREANRKAREVADEAMADAMKAIAGAIAASRRDAMDDHAGREQTAPSPDEPMKRRRQKVRSRGRTNPKVRSLRGVEIYTAKDGAVSIYIRYNAQGTPQHDLIGPSEIDAAGKDQTILKARRILAQRRAEVREANHLHVRWIPPKEREAMAKQEAAERQDGRRALLFEVATGRFIERAGPHYSDSKAVAGYFKRLGIAFKGKYLDAITRADVRRFYDDRLSNTGPFAGWPNKVGLRVPQAEVAMLSALYGFVEDEGYDVQNPCHRPRSRKYAMTKALTYRPARKKVIPTREQVRAIFDAAPSPIYRAALMVAYYTGARPESEWCSLTHGDVELPEPGKVRTLTGTAPAMGRAIFRDTKTGDDRPILLHPEAAEALRAIMLERPEDPAKVEAWERTPIFRRRDGSAWDRYTYRKGWASTLETASRTWADVDADDPDYQAKRKPRSRQATGYRVDSEGRIFRPTGDRFPELRRMVMRDFRSTFTTHTRETGTDRTIAAKIQGHSAEMNDHYLEVTGEAAARVILSLGPTPVEPTSYDSKRRRTTSPEQASSASSGKSLQN